MFTSWLIVLCGLTGAEDLFAARLETLRFHLDRLEAIEVPAPVQQEKAERLRALRDLLSAPVPDEATFNERYNAMDAT
ncbi:MAG TPA: hypothetical protein PKX28_08805, partial [Candidatus Hydrogenedentes bacterium]|nr:hypothetical protein [Candidatus Hydrogenedentota bacterium]